MSGVALAKLRALKKQEKIQDANDARFASALRLVVATDDNLRKLIERCNKSVPATQLERRAQKLSWWIAAGFRAGYEIDSVTMLNFFSELVGGERKVSDGNFPSLWNVAAARG